MKFIIPKNFNISPKILGTFDFYSILISTIFIVLTFFILNFFPINFSNKLSITITINLPLFLFLNFGIGKENILYILYYLLKYIFSTKDYIYTREN